MMVKLKANIQMYYRVYKCISMMFINVFILKIDKKKKKTKTKNNEVINMYLITCLKVIKWI